MTYLNGRQLLAWGNQAKGEQRRTGGMPAKCLGRAPYCVTEPRVGKKLERGVGLLLPFRDGSPMENLRFGFGTPECRLMENFRENMV